MKTQIRRLYVHYLGLFFLAGCTFTRPNVLPTPENEVIDSLIESYKDTLAGNPRQAIRLFTRLKHHSQDSLAIYKLNLVLAKAYFFANRPDTALHLNREVLRFCNRLDAPAPMIALQGMAYNSEGIFWQELSRRDSAFECYHKALDLLQNAGFARPSIDVCINLADCYQQDGNYPQSGFYYRKALYKADSLGSETRYRYPIFSGLAKLYLELDNFTLSDQYFTQAEKYWDKGSDYEKYFFANTRGNYYYRTAEYDRALDWFRKARGLVKNFPQPLYQAIVEGNLGEIFILRREADSARYYLDHSKQLFGHALQQPAFKFYMEGLYASLALLENNLPEAERLLLVSYDTASINPQYLYYHNRRMQELYERQKKYERAYSYRVKADAFDDSIRNIKMYNNLAEIDFRYRQDTAILKKDILLAKAEGKASRWQALAFLVGLASVLTGLLALGILIYRKRQREWRYARQKATIISLRMEIIRNRLSPHFIFNVLNAILPAFHQYRELDSSLRLLIRLLRDNLQDSEQICLSLRKEIERVKNYLSLRRIGKPDPTRVEWDISPDIDLETLVPSMSIQIPVENAVKYAFREDSPDPLVHIRIEQEKEGIRIVIEDNGVGYTVTQQAGDERGTGTGLKMLYRTVELLNIKNNQKMVFHCGSPRQKQGMQVSIIIPSNYNFSL